MDLTWLNHKEIYSLVGFAVLTIFLLKRHKDSFEIFKRLLESPQKGDMGVTLIGYYQGRKVMVASGFGNTGPSLSIEPKTILNPPKAFSLDKAPTHRTRLGGKKIYFNRPFFFIDGFRLFEVDINKETRYREILEELTAAAQRVETDLSF